MQSRTLRCAEAARPQLLRPIQHPQSLLGLRFFLVSLRRELVPFSQGDSRFRLTRTFQEAIDFTRHRGTRYLWVDLLCIMQDKHDPSDWLLESESMDKIYGNGFINLSVTASAGARQGLYRSRDPCSITPTCLSTRSMALRSLFKWKHLTTFAPVSTPKGGVDSPRAADLASVTSLHPSRVDLGMSPDFRVGEYPDGVPERIDTWIQNGPRLRI